MVDSIERFKYWLFFACDMGTEYRKFAATITALAAIAAFSYIQCDGHKKLKNDSLHNSQKPTIVQPLEDSGGSTKETENTQPKSSPATAAAILTPEEEAADKILERPTLEHCLDLAVNSRKFVRPGSKRFAGVLEKTAQDAKDKLAEFKRVSESEEDMGARHMLHVNTAMRDIPEIYKIFKDARIKIRYDMSMPSTSDMPYKIMQQLIEKSKGETGGELQLFFLNRLVSDFNEDYRNYTNITNGGLPGRAGYHKPGMQKGANRKKTGREIRKWMKDFKKGENRRRKYIREEIKDLTERDITNGITMPYISSENSEDIFFYMNLAVEHKISYMAENVMASYKNNILDLISRPGEYGQANETLKKAGDIIFESHGPCEKGADLVRLNTHESYMRAYEFFMQGTCYEKAFGIAQRMDNKDMQKRAIVEALKDGNRGTLTFLCSVFDSEAPVRRIKLSPNPDNPPQ